MARGDQLYVMRPLMYMDGVYEHHGIDCGDGTVIHYSKAGKVATVSRTSFEDFALGSAVRVKPQPIAYVPEVVIERAESRLGEQQYNLLTNNCEHFANWCKTGQNVSQQLLDYGVGLGTLDPVNSRWMVETAAAEGDPVEAMKLFTQAVQNGIIVRDQLLAQSTEIQKQMDTWQRVAQLALQRGREDLARAALEKKVGYKRQWTKVTEQMEQLNQMQETLLRNSQTLQQRIAIHPDLALPTSSS